MQDWCRKSARKLCVKDSSGQGQRPRPEEVFSHRFLFSSTCFSARPEQTFMKQIQGLFMSLIQGGFPYGYEYDKLIFHSVSRRYRAIFYNHQRCGSWSEPVSSKSNKKNKKKIIKIRPLLTKLQQFPYS